MKLGRKDQVKASSVTMMAYRFCGVPTSDQAHMLSQIAGSCRFLWNRMLADAQAQYEAGEKFFLPTPASYKKISGLEWLKGMDSLALANVQSPLGMALRNWGFPITDMSLWLPSVLLIGRSIIPHSRKNIFPSRMSSRRFWISILVATMRRWRLAETRMPPAAMPMIPS